MREGWASSRATAAAAAPRLQMLKNKRANAASIRDDLDSLGHPDYSDLPLGSYYSPQPVIPLLTSRGCYWSHSKRATSAGPRGAGEISVSPSSRRTVREGDSAEGSSSPGVVPGRVCQGVFDFARYIQAQRTVVESNLSYVEALESLWTAAVDVAGLMQLEHLPSRISEKLTGLGIIPNRSCRQIPGN